MYGDQALEVTGADDLAAALHRIGDSATPAVDQALADHGKTVVTEARSIAPRNTGALASAITSAYSPGTGLTVTAGLPYAYTFHAKELGRSNGYMVFRVPRHSRKGKAVGGYNALRPITSNPYLYVTWTRLQSRLTDAVNAALGKAVTGG